MTKNLTFPTIFVVNLLHDVEKRAHIEEQCAKVGLSPEFIEAIDGNLLSRQEIAAAYSKEEAVAFLGREMSAGEIGCALSHRNIFDKIVSENIEHALVLEDDVECHLDIVKILLAIGEFPLAWELVLLGHHNSDSRKRLARCSFWGSKKISSSCQLERPSEKAYGTYGYLINRRGAEKILQCSALLDRPIDHYTGDSIFVNLYASNPACVKICEYFSENYHSMADRQALNVALITSGPTKHKAWYVRMAKRFGVAKLLALTVLYLREIYFLFRPLKVYRRT